MSNTHVAILVALIIAPWPVIALALIVRGYDIHILFKRRRRGGEE